jgi:hypothetical protein
MYALFALSAFLAAFFAATSFNASSEQRWAKPVDAQTRKALRQLRRAGGGGRGDAAVTLKGFVSNRVIGPLQVAGEYRAIESTKTLQAQNLTIRNLVATNLQRGGIRLRGAIDGAQVTNFRLEMRSQPQFGKELPIGIHVESGNRITISDGVVRGFQMVRVPGNYTNGDGIAAERKVHDLTIRGVVASDNSDAGFDLKSSGTKLDQLRAERNGRNYRFWDTVDAGTLTSVNPGNAHVWAAKGANVRIGRLIASADRPATLVLAEGGANVVIESCRLSLPPGTQLVKRQSAGVQVSLGRGCE